MTLLELMVAIALLAVLGSMASKGLAQVIRARDVVFDEQVHWRSVAMAWARIGEDVTTAADGVPMEEAQVRWQGSSVDARWATWGPTGGVLPVQYSLRNGTLIRTLGTNLAHPQEAASDNTLSQIRPAAELDTPLLNGVRTLTLSYLDSQGEWQPRWPIEGANDTRPRAMRITLALDDGRDVMRIYALP